MDSILHDLIEHHVWANDTLLAFCETFTDDRLALTVPGTYGQVHRTLVHIAEAEQVYLSRILQTGIARTLDDEAVPLPAVAVVRVALRETGDAWRRVVDRWPNDLPISYIRQGRQEHRSVSFSVVQVLNHGSEHRNHIRTILSTHRLTPPEIDGWTWDEVRTHDRGAT